MGGGRERKGVEVGEEGVEVGKGRGWSYEKKGVVVGKGGVDIVKVKVGGKEIWVEIGNQVLPTINRVL